MEWEQRVERAGWNPWAALAGMPEVEVQFVRMADRLGWSIPYPGRPVVLIDERLSQVDKNAVLAHELVHLERDWPCRANWAEEERVHDEVARRLVPRDELHRWLVSRELDEAQVEAWHVAEEFHVPEPVAERAVRLLLDAVRGDIR